MKTNRWIRTFGFSVYMAITLLIVSCSDAEKKPIGSGIPLDYTQVHLEENSLLGNRLNINENVTLWHNMRMLEERGYFENFLLAAGKKKGEYRGNIHGYADSEVYKFIEGASYIYAVTNDETIPDSLEKVIRMIAAAQRPNGHIQTYDAVRGIDTIYSNFAWGSHRLYNAGHMYEGAVAHYLATGRKSFLNIAVKNADMMVDIFKDTTRNHVSPGHPEIEVGLMKLYHLTDNQDYFLLAKKLVDIRGSEDDIGQGFYDQKHLPILEQTEAVGHAVRAVYLYMGMTDLALESDLPGYEQMLDAVWENMVTKKMYVTGGIGSYHKIIENGELRGWEGFGENYDLPNDCYCESCAAIANALWNFGMYRLNGDTKYLDILEKVIFNNGLSMASLDGDLFYYQNELTSCLGEPHLRKEWQGCCTNNILRFYPQVPGFMYTITQEAVSVNLYSASTASFSYKGNDITIRQITDYPWGDEIRIVVNPGKKMKIPLKLRIPSWANNQPMFGDLYRFLQQDSQAVSVFLNNEKLQTDIRDNYLYVEHKWTDNDTLIIHLPMPVRRVISHSAVENNHSKVSIQRGPVIFCAESHDNLTGLDQLAISDNLNFDFTWDESILGGMYTLKTGDTRGNVEQPITLIPYYAWGHRGDGEMDVWLERLTD